MPEMHLRMAEFTVLVDHLQKTKKEQDIYNIFIKTN